MEKRREKAGFLGTPELSQLLSKENLLEVSTCGLSALRETSEAVRRSSIAALPASAGTGTRSATQLEF